MPPSADTASNLADIVDGNAPAGRDAIVFTEDGQHGANTLTYGELSDRVARMAAGLVETGLAPGDRIAILAGNRPEHFLVLLAALKAGLVAVPVNQKLLQEGVRYILEDAAVSLTFCDDRNAPLLPDGHARISFDDSAAFARFCDHDPVESVSAGDDSVAMIMYTSGSTGRPKGVPITHLGYVWAMRQFEFLRPVIEARSVLLAAPLFHMNAQFHLLATLQCGGTAVVLPRFDAGAFLRAIDSFSISRITGVPTMFVLLLRAMETSTRIDTATVRSVAMGSAPVSSQLLGDLKRAFPQADVSNGYGTTEAGPAIFGPHPSGLAIPPLSIGAVMPGVDVKLVGGASDDEGELWVRSPMVSPGYLNLPDATAAVFENGWYATGDLMRRDGEGFYYFVERNDDMLVCGGENVYPADVERRLEMHPDIREAAVVPIPDRVKGELPVAFVVKSPGAGLSEDDVRQHALNNGPAYAHPRYVEFVEALPLSGVNKVDRGHLKQRAFERFGGLRS